MMLYPKVYICLPPIALLLQQAPVNTKSCVWFQINSGMACNLFIGFEISNYFQYILCTFGCTLNVSCALLTVS